MTIFGKKILHVKLNSLFDREMKVYYVTQG